MFAETLFILFLLHMCGQHKENYSTDRQGARSVFYREGGEQTSLKLCFLLTASDVYSDFRLRWPPGQDHKGNDELQRGRLSFHTERYRVRL